MDEVLKVAGQTTLRAREVVAEVGVYQAWESVGAKVNLVGSLKMDLMVKHRDIDFHIYSRPLDVAASFAAMAKLADNPNVTRVEYNNLVETEERCLEWHAWYRDRDGDLWQLDMIHIEGGSRYDGYMEEVAERIIRALTPETREAILRCKFDTPDNVTIWGIEYYRAVLQGGVRSYSELTEWRRANPVAGVLEWMP